MAIGRAVDETGRCGSDVSQEVSDSHWRHQLVTTESDGNGFPRESLQVKRGITAGHKICEISGRFDEKNFLAISAFDIQDLEECDLSEVGEHQQVLKERALYAQHKG